jgi:tetratricopeptide (TPR) repeat protein
MSARWLDSWWLPLALGWLVASSVVAPAHADLPPPLAQPSIDQPPLAQPSIDLQRLAGWLGTQQSPADEPLLRDAADGQWGHHGLLDAALEAEGLSPPRAAEYANRLKAWAGELSQSPGDPRQRAAAVLAFLHRRVLHRYEARANGLAGTFAEGRYNCLGSTILFCALAQQVGCECWAVERPGHVLVRLRLPGRVIDVETTCPEGVEMTQSRGADERALSPLGLVGLVYFNRGCDLLRRQQFRAAMSANVAALRLDPANARARTNLLGTWNNWALALARRGDRQAAMGLLRQGLELVPADPLFSANLHAISRLADDPANR